MTNPSDAPQGPMPKPPYYAVIFSSRRTSEDSAGYAKAAERMLKLASDMPEIGRASCRERV